MTAEQFLTEKGVWNYNTNIKLSINSLIEILNEFKGIGLIDAGSRIGSVLFSVSKEIDRAKAKHGPQKFNSAHEGYAILLEEVDELKAEVWKSKHDKKEMRAEAIQVAAMAVRFVDELTNDN